MENGNNQNQGIMCGLSFHEFLSQLPMHVLKTERGRDVVYGKIASNYLAEQGIIPKGEVLTFTQAYTLFRAIGETGEKLLDTILGIEPHDPATEAGRAPPQLCGGRYGEVGAVGGVLPRQAREGKRLR